MSSTRSERRIGEDTISHMSFHIPYSARSWTSWRPSKDLLPTWLPAKLIVTRRSSTNYHNQTREHLNRLNKFMELCQNWFRSRLTLVTNSTVHPASLVLLRSFMFFIHVVPPLLCRFNCSRMMRNAEKTDLLWYSSFFVQGIVHLPILYIRWTHASSLRSETHSFGASYSFRVSKI